ncbi:MAG: SEC-C domain-containing protein, partial [Pseudomonadales bacterium]|nr:SEC-C domain-containing protein [Pseudomonadales bacterium]
IALDDEIMRIFGGDKIAGMMSALKVPENVPIEAKLINRSLESAQTKVEGFFFDQRQRLVEYDDVMNKHREIIYKRRRNYLEMATVDNPETVVDENDETKRVLGEEILSYIEKLVAANVEFNFTDKEGDEIYKAIVSNFGRIIPYDEFSLKNLEKKIKEIGDQEKIIDELCNLVHKTAEAREKTVGHEIAREMEKYVMLSTIDEKWMAHLESMDSLRDGIWMRGSKEQVIAEYKKEAFTMFDGLIGNIETTVAERFFRFKVNPQAVRAQSATNLQKARTVKENVNESIAKEIADSQKTMTDDEIHDLEAWEKSQATPTATKVSGDAASLAAALQKMNSQPRSTASVSAAAPVQAEKKADVPGRNDPCHCGSGLKYKKCCLNKDAH